MEKFIKIENKTGLVFDTKIIDLESGIELQNSVKSLTINSLIPGVVITGSMEIYVSEMNIDKLKVSIAETSDDIKQWGEAYDRYYKNDSIWKRLFRALAKGFLRL